MSASSTTYASVLDVKKPPGWCKENGVEHSWRDGPTLTCDPPIATRMCINCGKRERLTPPSWE